MFDPTVSLGSLLTIASFLVIVVLYIASVRADTKVLNTRLGNIDMQMGDFKEEMKKLTLVIIEQTKQDGRISNIETRMLMEGQRIDAMESTFRNYLMVRKNES